MDSVRSRSSRGQSVKLTKAQAALEQLKAARDKRESRVEQYQIDSDDELYDVVPENEYQELVRRRQAEDDFVVDDEGMGYADNGEEYLDRISEDEDDEKTGLKRSQLNGKGDNALKKARKLNQLSSARSGETQTASILKYMVANGKTVGPGMSSITKSKVADPLLNIDDMLDDLTENPLGDQHIPPKATKKFDRYSHENRSVDYEPNVPLASDIIMEFQPMQVNDFEFVDFTNDVNDQDQDINGKEYDSMIPEKTEKVEIKKLQTRSRFAKSDIMESNPIFASTKQIEEMVVEKPPDTAHVPNIDIAENPYIFSALDISAEYAAPTCSPVLADSEQWFEKDSEGVYMKFFWLDACEEQGLIYMFGKVKTGELNGAPRYSSTCVVVNGTETTLLVLPRLLNDREGEDIEGPRKDSMEVHKEIRALLTPKYVPHGVMIRCKSVNRKYAFNLTDIPRKETQYLKVWYTAKGTKQPSSEVCSKGGSTFKRIIGGRTSLLENFLLKRKLMGPCWLIIRHPNIQKDNVSWCKVEISVNNPKHIVKMGSRKVQGSSSEVSQEATAECMQPPEAPSLVSISLSMKTVINPITNVHEAVSIAALVHTRILMDSHSVVTPNLMHSWVGIRSLGRSFAANGQYPGVLPHDMNAAVAQANKTARGVQLEAFADETRLLQRVFSLFLHYDPDIITGHNILGFDLDVLLTSAKKQGVRRIWSAIGRLRREVFPSTFSGNTVNGRETFGAGIAAGRLICDTYISAKEFLKETIYSLTHLCASQLDTRRNDIDPADIPGLYVQGAAAIVNLAQHTAFDSALVQKLMLHLQVIPLSKQLTGLSGGLWSRTLRLGRAERIEYLLLHEFHERKYITPERLDFTGKSGGRTRAKAAYAGGLVLEPKRGLYDDYILLLDFNSLYPSIIQEYNLCFTTVDWTKYIQMPTVDTKSAKRKGKTDIELLSTAMDCGSDGEAVVNDDEELLSNSGKMLPPIPDDVPPGVLPKVIKTLVERRGTVKKMLKAEKDPVLCQELDIRQKALKLTANSMYGCLGFIHGRFCAQPIAALVTSKGREALQRTVEVTQTQLGLEVVYGDTDSIMVNTHTKDLMQAKQQGAMIKREVNKLYGSLELELDGIFKTLLLLKKKKYAALVIDQMPDGKQVIKKEVKGLDLVRRDWCGLSKEAGQHVLDCILSGLERDTVLENIHDHLRALSASMRNKSLPIGQYIITKGISKPPQEYPNAKNEPHLQVAIAMQKAGKPIAVGMHIPYIICESKPAEEGKQIEVSPADRAYHPEEVIRSNGTLVPDIDWYLTTQVVPPIARLCEPIEGTSAATIADLVGLDPSRFNKGSAGGGYVDRADDEWAFIPSCLKPDADRFKDCFPISAQCISCKTASNIPWLLSWEAAEGLPKSVEGLQNPLICPSCSAPLWGHANEAAAFSSLLQKLTLAIRSAQMKAAEAWYICDDPCCGARARDVGVKGGMCPESTCTQGKLYSEYSPKDLYEQLKSFEALFDLKRAKERCADRIKLSVSDIELPSAHERIIDLLFMRAKSEVESNSYNWVSADIWRYFFC